MWAIHTVELGSTQPRIHLIDRKVDLHLEVFLDSRETHLYIGNKNPYDARFYVVLDMDGIEVEHAKDFTKQDLQIIDNVLETLNQGPSLRRKVLAAYFEKALPSLQCEVLLRKRR